VHGVREGHGKITFKDGSFYRGEMQKNQMWGHGIFVGEWNPVQLYYLYDATLFCRRN
jgi:hypothetical protein